MNAKTYIVTFDALDPDFDPRALKRFISSNEQIGHWWNHLPYVYLLTSPLDAEALGDRLRAQANGVRFLVMEVDPANSDGALAEVSWDWIRSRERETGEAEKV